MYIVNQDREFKGVKSSKQFVIYTGDNDFQIDFLYKDGISKIKNAKGNHPGCFEGIILKKNEKDFCENLIEEAIRKNETGK